MRLFILVLVLLIAEVKAQRAAIVASAIQDTTQFDSHVIRLGELKAFPTATGYGCKAWGGRGGAILEVTNLNNTGAGSFRELAANTSGARTVVFNVSGYIDISFMPINNDSLTILAHTAPSPGITFRGANTHVRSSETVIRHYRSRVGADGESGSDAMSVVANVTKPSVSNIILDHCSFSWGLDENISFGGSATNGYSLRNVTMQHSLSAEPFNNYHSLIGSNVEELSLVRNAYINGQNRIPESTYGTGEEYEFSNNIIYNYSRPTTVATEAFVDVVGNIYKAGTNGPNQANLYYQVNSVENPTGDLADGHLYALDNLQVGSNPSGMKNTNWSTYEKSTPFHTASPYQEVASADLHDLLINDVGATVNQDAVDSRVLTNYINGTGSKNLTDEDTVGGYPTLAENTHPGSYDADDDHVADAWETEMGITGVDVTTKPDSFTINGITFDNRAYSGGTWDGNKYVGGTLAGGNLYTWREIFWADLAGDFETFKWQ